MSTIQNEIDRIKESVADAYETVELMGGDVPSPDLQKIDTLSDSIATIKGGSGGGGSENILLNWDFRNPVNRSGSTTYTLTTTRCTVDSWYSENGCAVNVVDGGVTFDPKNDATCVFGQNVKEWELMKGKTVTFSALVSNVSAAGLNLWIYGVEGPVALPAIEVGNDVVLYSITGTVDNGASSLRCGIQAVSSTATIKMIAAKLEYGSKQTLAKQNSDNVWEILDPPNYDLQYILCSQYDPITDVRIGSKHSNVNFIQNWYFPQPVNRNGKTSGFVQNEIVIDRWSNFSNDTNVWVTSSGIEFFSWMDGSTKHRAHISHVLSEGVFEFLVNKQATFSYLTASGELGVVTEVVSPTAVMENIIGTTSKFQAIMYRYVGYMNGRFCVMICGNNTTLASGDYTEDNPLTDTIVAVKLELGPVQTLARKEGDIWVLNDVPDYDTQYLLCSQYDPTKPIPTRVELQKKITGTTSQTAGFDANGNLAAVASAPVANAIVSDGYASDKDMNNAPRGKIVNYLYYNNDDQASYHSPMGELYGTTGETWYIVETFGLNNRTVQTAAAPYNYQRKFFIRFKHDTTWSPWREIASLSDIPTVSNPNLLLNWDFRNPVNRNGKMEYGSGYCIDSWYFYTDASGGKLSINDSGIVIQANSGKFSGIHQNFKSYNVLSGKTATFSVLTDEGLTSVTFTIGSYKDYNSPVNSNLHLISVNNQHALIRVYNTEVMILGIKLELGSTQTLAKKNASGEWEIIDPPNYDLQYLLTSQYSPINGAYVGIQHSNPNLLDNWYFADPINQRGQTEYGVDQTVLCNYSIDRWLFLESGEYKNEKLSVQENGIDLNHGWVVQRFENIQQFVGKVMTFTVLTQDGSLYSGTNTFRLSVDTVFVMSSEKYPYLAYNLFWKGFEFGCSGTIVAAKLELGPVQTLAHKEGDTWVLNDPPPNKQQELAKCQRYLQVYGRGFNDIGSITFIQTDSNQTGNLNVNTNLPQRMRANPVVTGLDSLQLRLSTEGAPLTGTTTFTPFTSVDSVGFIVKNENIISGKRYTVGTNDIGKKLVISAEL